MNNGNGNGNDDDDVDDVSEFSFLKESKAIRMVWNQTELSIEATRWIEMEWSGLRTRVADGDGVEKWVHLVLLE